MMVKPSATELLKVVDNRYALVIATAKRARQIVAGDPVLTKEDVAVPVTIAVNEISEGKVTIC